MHQIIKIGLQKAYKYIFFLVVKYIVSIFNENTMWLLGISFFSFCTWFLANTKTMYLLHLKILQIQTLFSSLFEACFVWHLFFVLTVWCLARFRLLPRRDRTSHSAAIIIANIYIITKITIITIECIVTVHFLQKLIPYIRSDFKAPRTQN